MRTFTGKCRTAQETITAYLWERETWVPAHELVKLETPYGYVGNSGDVRARELARNECPDKLKGKVERAEGRDIGLDPRFAYFRYREPNREPTVEEVKEWSKRAVAAFDTGRPLPA